MFGTLVDYWYLTGDDQYNDLTLEGMVFQAGEDRTFRSINVSHQLGNDDQGFWAMSAMSAAELNFPNPPEDGPQWLAMAQGCFNEWVGRWEEEVCGGGMRWQIVPINTGYTFKNTISNGVFFNVAARLARYTGNVTYADWANKIWDWHVEYEIFTPDYQILDGLHLNADGTGGGCDQLDLIQWSYNIGIFLHGAAYLYEKYEEPKWLERLQGLITHAKSKFYRDEVAFEQFCEEAKLCDLDQRSFKGYLTRWLAWASVLVPEVADEITPLIQKSGAAAAAACSGVDPVMPGEPPFAGRPGTACGFSWLTGDFDDISGVGEQMNALDAVMYNIIGDVDLPFTADTGGSSVGDVNAGGDDISLVTWDAITIGDRVGAGFLTTLVLAGLLGGCTFLII